MSIHYSVEPISGRITTRADGILTFHEINAHLDLEERNQDLHRPELIDARAADTDLSTEQVRRLVQRAARMVRDVKLGPTAIVTTNDVVFGMARMFSILAESVGVDAAVFRDVPSATRWLEDHSTSLSI